MAFLAEGTLYHISIGIKELPDIINKSLVGEPERNNGLTSFRE